MAESIENQIKKLILNYKYGKIFFPANFTKFGTSTVIRKALNRLEDKGLLVRLVNLRIVKMVFEVFPFTTIFSLF